MDLTEASLSRTARALLAFLNRLLSQLANFFLAFIITPLIVANLGAEMYGAWRIIQKCMRFLAMGHFKPMGLLKLILANEIGSEDQRKRELIGASLSIWVLTLPLLFGLAGVLLYFSPHIIPVDKELQGQVFYSLLIAMAVVIIDPVLGMPNAVLKGMNMEYRILGLDGFATLLATLMIYFVVMHHYSLPWVVGVSTLQVWLISLVSYIVTKKALSWFGINKPSKADIMVFFKLNLWTLLSTLSRNVFRSADLILISMYFSVTAAAVYSLTLALMSRLLEPVLSLFQAGLPGVGDLLGRGEMQRVRQLRAEKIRALMFAATVIGALVISFNQAFVGLWVGSEFFGGPTLSYWMIAAVTLTILIRTESIFLDAALYMRENAIVLSCCALIYIVLVYVLKDTLGVIAIPVGQVIALTLLMFCYWVILRRGLNESYRRLFALLFRPLLPASALLVLFSYSPAKIVDSWLMLFVEGAQFGLMASFLSWYLILDKWDRQRLSQRLLRLFNKKLKNSSVEELW